MDECRRLLAAAREKEWLSSYALALTTGMRPSEYLALKWSDSDWQRGAASICRTIQHQLPLQNRMCGWTAQGLMRLIHRGQQFAVGPRETRRKPAPLVGLELLLENGGGPIRRTGRGICEWIRCIQAIGTGSRACITATWWMK